MMSLHLAGMLCSGPGVQPSALAGRRALGGPLLEDRLDSGLKKLAAAPRGPQFLNKIR